MITILSCGASATVQDLGRPGYAALGVPRSGAFDRGALALANRLVGNPPDAACLELTLGARLRVDAAATVALTGAPCPGLDWGTPVTLAAGSTLALGVPALGLRSYLAVRGGVNSDPVLSSRSTDTLSGLGPAPLAAGDVLAIGPQPAAPPSGTPAVPAAPFRGPLRILPGPREDWFTAGARALLVESIWTVRPDSNRLGLRLDGPALARAISRELPSEPTVPGALQVPPDGRPILFGPDAPVTGGYPVIAVIRDADLNRAAQLRPGEVVRFSR